MDFLQTELTVHHTKLSALGVCLAMSSSGVLIDLFHYDVTVCLQNAQNCLIQMLFPKLASDDAPDGSNTPLDA